MMEYAEGGDLEGYIEKQSASWSWHERMRLLHEVGLGMSVLHDGIVSIVHRDLKASAAANKRSISGHLYLLKHCLRVRSPPTFCSP